MKSNWHSFYKEKLIQQTKEKTHEQYRLTHKKEEKNVFFYDKPKKIN